MDVYEAIHRRRDVRRFRPDPVPQNVLGRVLEAAHHAPSAGFMQPWDFIVIRTRAVREHVKALFDQENARAAALYTGARRALYDSLILEGILEAPLNLCVTCNRTRGGVVLGRSAVFDTDLMSTCLAVENLWLAARAEGLGVGWVSILDYGALARVLQLPSSVVPVAYLCLGYPAVELDRPLLETVGWRERIPLDTLVHYERYGRRTPP